MITVGLTGGIGSGKTLISEVFNRLGIPIFNADYEAKKIMNSDDEVILQIKAEFGDDIYNAESINRKKLAGIIFADEKALQKINSIVHPKVREYFINWTKEKTNYPYVIEEAAILFESNAYKELDITINVHANELVRINRVVERDQVSTEAVKSRMKNQMSDKERISLADYTIYNDGERMVLPQVLEIHQKILNTQK
jgi:dephospho-CoA kinase